MVKQNFLTAQLEESHTQGPAMPMQLSTLTLLISDSSPDSERTEELVIEKSDSQVQISGNNKQESNAVWKYHYYHLE